MENVESYLKKNTGYDWEEISQLYLKFKLSGAPFGRMCVVTPDDIRKQRARLYIPEASHSLHNPDEFSENYLKKVAHRLPSIKVDLDTIPGMTIFSVIPTQKGRQMIALTLKLDGDLILTRQNSSNKLTIGMNSIKSLTMNAQIAVNETLAKLGGQYDIDKGTFRLSASSLGDFYADNVSLTSNSFSASMTPKPIKTNYGQWIIEGQLGYEVNGIIDNHDDQEPNLSLATSMLPTPDSDTMQNTTKASSLFTELGLLIVFVLMVA